MNMKNRAKIAVICGILYFAETMCSLSQPCSQAAHDKACMHGQTQTWKAIKANAENGDPQAQYLLGRMHEYGICMAENPVLAAKWYRKAAEQGLASAQYALGRLYASGEGVSQDDAEAMKWLTKAAAQDYALAQNRLGVMYEKGQGVAKDYIEAYKWYSLAADGGRNIFGVANQENLACRMSPHQLVESQRRAESVLAHSDPPSALFSTNITRKK
jgi:TPR repeat protein